MANHLFERHLILHISTSLNPSCTLFLRSASLHSMFENHSKSSVPSSDTTTSDDNYVGRPHKRHYYRFLFTYWSFSEESQLDSPRKRLSSSTTSLCFSHVHSTTHAASSPYTNTLQPRGSARKVTCPASRHTVPSGANAVIQTQNVSWLLNVKKLCKSCQQLRSHLEVIYMASTYCIRLQPCSRPALVSHARHY